MKNKASFILILLFFSFVISCLAQEPYINLNGSRPIKKIKVKDKTYYDDNVIHKYFSFNYNKQKGLIRETSQNKLLDFSPNIITYNDKGDILKSNQWEYKYIYDDKGVLILKEYYYDKILSGKMTYIYNNNQKLMEENFMDLYDSILMSKELYEYDIEGNLFKKTGYDYIVGRGYYDVIEYDKEGKVISQKVFDPNDSLFSHSIYKYDDTLLIETNNKQKGVCDAKTIFKYNKNKVLIDETYYLCDTIRSRYEKKYDDKERIVEYRYLDPDINRYSLFEYDDTNQTITIKEYYYDTYNESKEYISPNYKKVIYYLDDNLKYTEILKWDKWGNIIEIIRYDSNNNLKRNIKYKYSFWD